MSRSGRHSSRESPPDSGSGVGTRGTVTSRTSELVLGIALIAGVRVRWAALGSAVLLTLFGLAMAVSFGLKSPLDYSVFSASACAALLALHPLRTA